MSELDFSRRLIAWQKTHGRHDLPWQGPGDAYRVWLSEIMLQQTQVTTVIPYYQRFVGRFPTIGALAAAPLDDVLEAWAGLGYYARARNLHRCARIVVERYAGIMPREIEALLELPGIGRSTAAAIAAFSYGVRAAILDGNVKRVLTRCFGIEGYPGTAANERTLWALSEALLPEGGIESYTQGLMDLGSTLCTRRNPFCMACPMRDECVAFRDGRQHILPAPRPKKSLPERESDVLILTDGEQVLLERRPETGIWGGLLSLPEGGVAEARFLARRHGCRLCDMRAWGSLRHTFTHFRLTMHALLCRVEWDGGQAGGQVSEPAGQWTAVADIERAALPTPIRRLLRPLAEAN